jgi:hypothetical protein
MSICRLGPHDWISVVTRRRKDTGVLSPSREDTEKRQKFTRELSLQAS